MNKPNLLKQAAKYAKANNLSTGSNIIDFAKDNEAAILEFSKGSSKLEAKKNDEDIQQYLESNPEYISEMSAHLDSCMKKSGDESKRLVDALIKKTEERTAANELIRHNAIEQKRKLQAERLKVLSVNAIPFDNYQKPFGTPDTIHKMGDHLFIFSVNKDGILYQNSVNIAGLKAKGTAYYVDKIGATWTEAIINRLWQIENSQN